MTRALPCSAGPVDPALVADLVAANRILARQLATALSFRRPITFITADEAQDPRRLDDAWELWRRDA